MTKQTPITPDSQSFSGENEKTTTIHIPSYIKDKKKRHKPSRNSRFAPVHKLKAFSITRIKAGALSLLAGLYAGITATSQKAYAKGDVTEVTDGIDVLKDIVLAAVSGVGIIFLAWGLLDFGTAYSAHETSQQSAAIKKVVGGIIMIAVPAILKALGAS